MAVTTDIRISGVSLPPEKHTNIALTYIFGVGPTRANQICEAAQIDKQIKLKELNDEQIDRLRKEVSKFTVEGDLRRLIGMNIKQKMDMRSYEGLRHRKHLPVRGQRTKSNARTRKGKRKR